MVASTNYIRMLFLGEALTTMIVYIGCRRNPFVCLQFLWPVPVPGTLPAMDTGALLRAVWRVGRCWLNRLVSIQYCGLHSGTPLNRTPRNEDTSKQDSLSLKWGHLYQHILPSVHVHMYIEDTFCLLYTFHSWNKDISLFTLWWEGLYILCCYTYKPNSRTMCSSVFCIFLTRYRDRALVLFPGGRVSQQARRISDHQNTILHVSMQPLCMEMICVL